MNIKARIRWRQYDPQGNLVDEKEHDANSLVKAFAQSLLAVLAESTVITTKDTSNSDQSNQASQYPFDIRAGAADDNYGILVGTGTTAVAITDYNLETKIAHGAGAGQLEHGAVAYDTSVSVAGSTASFNIHRTFDNKSGGSIIIQEVGLVSKSSTGWYFLLDHSLSEYEITNGNNAVVNYELSITV